MLGLHESLVSFDAQRHLGYDRGFGSGYGSGFGFGYGSGFVLTLDLMTYEHRLPKLLRGLPLLRRVRPRLRPMLLEY